MKRRENQKKKFIINFFNNFGWEKYEDDEKGKWLLYYNVLNWEYLLKIDWDFFLSAKQQQQSEKA